MKRLMIVRHAKSDWGDIDLKDFDRPLNQRGLHSAPDMAERLQKNRLVPQYLLSSPALRAKTTANIFAKTLNLAEPAYNRSIYEADYNTLLKIVNGLPDAYSFVVIFGHNPGMSSMLFALTGQMYDMPTCAIAIIDFELESWKMVSGDLGSLSYYDYPKNDE